MSDERETVKPLAHVYADGFMQVRDNAVDYSGSVVHPHLGAGDYFAPLQDGDQFAKTTRLHEFVHLHLLTSGLQPFTIHEAFRAAEIQNPWLQAMADAKVTRFCEAHGMSMRDLHTMKPDALTAEAWRVEASRNGFRRLQKWQQASELLRTLGTRHEEFFWGASTLSEDQKAYIRRQHAAMDDVKTLDDWVKTGLTLQTKFETPSQKAARKKAERELEKDFAGEGEPSEGEGGEGAGGDDEAKGDEKEGEKKPAPKHKPKESKKEKARNVEKLAKHAAEKFKAKEDAERSKRGLEPSGEAEGAERPHEMSKGGVSSGMKTGAVVRGSTERVKAKALDMRESVPEKSETEKMAEEFVDAADLLDKRVIQHHDPESFTKKDIQNMIEGTGGYRRAEWGKLTIAPVKLEKFFEPKEKSRSRKPSFMGAFRYPHRMTSDSAVFCSKMKGKGGTLLIDCSGSMHVRLDDLIAVLEKRPYAQIALYASNGTLTGGYLIVVTGRQRRVTDEVLDGVLAKLESGNVVDGPALEWLAKQSGEKFWICDGGVTGVGDTWAMNLAIEAALLTRRYHVKRWHSIHSFLTADRPDYAG